MQINYSYKDVPTLKKFTEDDSFIRGVLGPFGSGKSAACTIETLRRAMGQNPSPVDKIRKTRFAVIRNTYKQLEDTTIKTFDQWIPMHKLGRYNISEHTFYCDKIPGVYFEVLFRALDRPDHIKNLLSLELTGAWVNEARDVPKSIIDALQGRVGRYPSKLDGGATWYGLWMDTNPPDDDSWWYKLFEEDRPSNAAHFKQPSGLSKEAENLPNLPDNYYQNLAMGKDSDFVNVYIKAEYGYVRDGKPVYPNYRDSLHCAEFDLHKGVTIYRGWDFGLTPACSFSYITSNGQWRIFDEMVSDNMGIDRFSDDVLNYCIDQYSGFKFIDIGDPAGNMRSQTDERTCFDILHGKKIMIDGGDQDPNIRIESVKYPLDRLTDGSPAFLIHPRCKMLRKGFQGKYEYRRMQTTVEKYVDKPDKNDFSHIHDSLQYVATHLFADRLRGHVKPTVVRPDDGITFMDLVNSNNTKKHRL